MSRCCGRLSRQQGGHRADIFAKKSMGTVRTHLSAPETALSRGLLPPAHINLPSIVGNGKNTDMIQTLKGSG